MMRSPFDVIDVPENTAKRNGDQMRTEKWIIFGMLVHQCLIEKVSS